MARYNNVAFVVGGKVQYQNSQWEGGQPDTAQDVPTIVGGHQGVALGPPQTKFTLTNMVATTGSEFDWASAKRTATPINFTALVMGTNLKLDGKFIVRDIEWSSSAGAPIAEKIMLSSVQQPGQEAPWFK
jgi:hypothetical protein